MLDLNQNGFDNSFEFQRFDNPNFSYDSELRQRPPFFPTPGGGNFPQGDDFSNDFEGPPDFNFPGGKFNPPGMPKSAPPNYIPNKNGPGIQKFSAAEGPSTYAVSANSIRFCLYKYTYIWERNGRNYWTFLLNVDRRSVSGFRWTGRRWIYFGLDLRRIDSFVCYRSETNEQCENCEGLRSENIEPSNDKIEPNNDKIEYSKNQIKDVYTQTLTHVEVPEIKEDYITRSLGIVDNIDVKSDIPCVKMRNLSYRIILEVTYPTSFDDNLKNNITMLANEAGAEAAKVFNSNRNNVKSANTFENFNNCISVIPESLHIFTESFNSKLQSLNLPYDEFNSITYSIRKEKIYNDWTPYFSTL